MAQLKQYARPSVLESVKMFYKYAFNFEDRSRRSELWYVLFFKIAINLLYFLLFVILDCDMVISWKLLMVYPVELLIDLVPILSLTVRRLHDCEVNTLWILGMFIPFVCIVSTPYVIFNCLFVDSKVDELCYQDSVKYYYE